MKKTINLATISIDGQKLKTAREERGISAADIAASLTLSRAQIIHIEEGGDKPFYTPAHKLLAVRKYAQALNIPYEEVVIGEGSEQTIPAPEEAPPSMRTYSNNSGNDLSKISATEDRMTAASRNTNTRRRIFWGTCALCVLIALYAKVRGTYEEVKLPQDSQVQEEPSASEPLNETPLADVADATVAPYSVAAATEIASKPATVAQASKPVSEIADEIESASEENCAAEPAGSNLKSWSPAYQRKADMRLFVISPKASIVCVTDNSGKARLVNLRPMVGEPFSGKPPYTIRSKHLSSMNMYLQGFRVKVPADAKVMRVIPTTVMAPESDSEQPASATETESAEAN